MPWDYEETVRIDAEDILDYVQDNKEWFLDRLGCSSGCISNTLVSLENRVGDLLNKYDDIRRFRDISSANRDDQSVKLYEDLIDLKIKIHSMLGECK